MVGSSVSGMDSSSFPTTAQVRQAHPGELAVALSTLSPDAVAGLAGEQAEAVVVATQRVASWAHALQAVAVDRFAEQVVDDQQAHAAELVAARDAQRALVTAAGRTWRGGAGAVALPEPEQVAASMLAPLLRISPRTMRTRLIRARALMELPRTLAFALAGELEPWRADAVVAAARDVAADRLVELEARLYAADVTDLPKPRLVERVRRAAAKADPDGVTASVRRAPDRRSLRVAPAETAGLMRWSLEVPDDASRRLFAAVDALAQEYLTTDQQAAAAAPGGHGRERRGVEAARLDALVDLVMANAQVQTLVELVVPVDAGSATFVTRPDARTAAATELARSRHRRTPWATSGAAAGPVATTANPDPTDPGIDDVAVDLVLGAVTVDTLAAGELERGLGLVLGGWLEVAANPFLTTVPDARPPTRPPEHRGPLGATPRGPTRSLPPPDSTPPPERVWFVDGLVDAPGAAALLPAQVVALLHDPDTRIRVTTSEPGAADGPAPRRRTYRPGRALAASVRARDRHCRFPGCSVPASRCHLDHVTAFPHGQTVEANLQALCPAHHGFKHHAGWAVTMTPDGTCAWTAPTGRTHTTTPGSARDHAA